MDFCLHTYAGQTDRVFNPFLVVDSVFLRDNVQNTMLIAYADRFRGMHHVLNVVQRDFFF
ncbi:Uncharacterised protein [Raoultella ornithinolytica]|nr:Uncharacterised protein [Raoultella ornithinolytica]